MFFSKIFPKLLVVHTYRLCSTPEYKQKNHRYFSKYRERFIKPQTLKVELAHLTSISTGIIIQKYCEVYCVCTNLPKRSGEPKSFTCR